MADEMYQPDQAKRGPGRPPKSTLQGVEESAIKVDEGLTADVSLSPSAQSPGEENVEQAIARIRQIRQPFGAYTQKLALAERPGYHRHWFNDAAGRVDEAKASGWSHVINPRDGNPLSRVVGTGRDNGVLKAYAMEIPNVFWQEEMDARHDATKAKIDAIKKNPFSAKPGQAQRSDSGKFYDPDEASGKGPLQVVGPKG